ncbi:hypothetical protein I4F81_010442 [Pyropia yezoensis]|uniref:Uncharacterized protein n=1 Tax=Pyropia yezoensis TaxID=2788 RepID=A0ACC3CCG6_PYRYE|nr:hypothetical protein I4F81_010442 [Neopyropia yezoensis]
MRGVWYAVVLTTGGYCAPGNPVLAAAAPAGLAGLPSTNAPLASGDGVRLAARLGAGTVDMDALQVHPTGFVPLGDAPPAGEGAAAAAVAPPPPPTVFLAPEALRGCGGVLLDAAGGRFVNELDARDVVTAAMTAAAAGGGGGDGRRRVFLVLSAAAVGAFGEATAAFYAARGLMARIPPPSAAADGGGGGVLAALDARVGLPAAAVAATLAAYARSVGGVADGTSKKVFPQAVSYELERLEREGLWVAAVTPALHYSMGGLTFSASAEVLSAATAKPIRRLYAAGEVTGGLFGGNRLGGCSLLDCAVSVSALSARSSSRYSEREVSTRYGSRRSLVVRSSSMVPINDDSRGRVNRGADAEYSEALTPATQPCAAASS